MEITVTDIIKINPAKKAGLKVRDIIIKVNGENVNTVEELAATIDDVAASAKENVNIANAARANADKAGEQIKMSNEQMHKMNDAMNDIHTSSEEIAKIIELVNDKSRIAVCLDTCHINDAGYDIVNDYEKIFVQFNEIVGFKYLKVIHINDSKSKNYYLSEKQR